MNEKIFRSDDYSVHSKMPQVKEFFEPFKKYNVPLYPVLIMKDIEKNVELIEWLIDNNNLLRPQLHCWEHFDFNTLDDNKVHKQLVRCLNSFRLIFGYKPEWIWTPWNKQDERVREIIHHYGLKTTPLKVSLSQYIKSMGDVNEQVINTHYWHEPDLFMIDSALQIYTKKTQDLTEEEKNRCL